MSDNPDIYRGRVEFISNGKTRRQIIIKKKKKSLHRLASTKKHTHTQYHRNENSINLDYSNQDLELTVN